MGFDGPADVDLGGGRLLWFVGWSPDRELNPQYRGVPDVDRWGAQYSHPDAREPSRECGGFVTFDGEAQRAVHPNVPKWTVESMEPLTLSPSLLCTVCGDHGFIRGGRWVAA